MTNLQPIDKPASIHILRFNDDAVYINANDLLSLLQILAEDQELSTCSQVSYEALATTLKRRINRAHG